ncbi:DUF2334 domain-containing protein [Thiofilum flexile]|uniref:DUF2334 domain-containing protein n=1 Tax=Thiofilum flexile TaxID=125627 RepID=UPI0003816732|nr:DUF2334 domain-containing protein [Thiofilum flexile]
MKKYIIRFDDICPTMNWDNWEDLEKELIKLNIKPIIGVIPDNKDKKLMIGSIDEKKFWERIRHFDQLGWTIALHGLHHTYETQDSGLLKLNNRSEFAGLPYDIQSNKIRKALDIFTRNQINIKIWMAPAHSFDENTILALRENNINIITDGFYSRPVIHLGITWIPQQLWNFKRHLFPGIWTICFHHNNLSTKDIYKIIENLNNYKKRIISVDDLLKNHTIQRINFLDICFNFLWRKKIHINSNLHKYIGLKK